MADMTGQNSAPGSCVEDGGQGKEMRLTMMR